MGVWIETLFIYNVGTIVKVTPCVGVWIETKEFDEDMRKVCHTLRGCVD